METVTSPKIIIGWREWLALPDLGIPALKAKIDTGARTSALHAFSLEPFAENGVKKIRFQIHPLQKRRDIEITCVANIIDHRRVSDSGGHHEMRYVIRAPIILGSTVITPEITLTDRDTMRFRMLLGRTALAETFIVDSAQSYRIGKRPANLYGIIRKVRKK